MPDYSTLVIFVTAAIILLIVPGPAVIYITAQSIDKGTKAGIVSTLGIASGTIVHVIAAALGLSTILMTSAAIYSIIKYAGACYLIYLGIKKFISKDNDSTITAENHSSLRKIFYDGMIVNIFNPKTALFFLSFLPQFVVVDKGSVISQMLFLGSLFVVMGILSDGLYAVTASKFGRFIKRKGYNPAAQNYFTGTVYIALGIYAALSGSKNK